MKLRLVAILALGISCKTRQVENDSQISSNIPESGPVQSVIVSVDPGGALNETISAIAKAIPAEYQVVTLSKDKTRSTGNQMSFNIPDSAAPTWESPWTRDYMPELVKREDGKFRLVLFNYYYPGSKSVGRYVAKKFKGIEETLELPYFVEGGNLIVDDDRNLFISEKAVLNSLMLAAPSPSEAIQKLYKSANERDAWSTPKDAAFAKLKAEMTTELTKALNLKTLSWLPPLNYESGSNSQTTGHLDIFMKYLGRQKFLVGEIEIPSGVKKAKERARLTAQAQTLDRVSEQLTKLGNQVTRIPFSVRFEQGGIELFSYTNSLILDRTAIVPTYFQDFKKTDPNRYVSDEEVKENEALKRSDEVAKKLYSSLGFTVKSVQARTARYYGGQIHCLTKHIPAAAGVSLGR